jgi:predicted membrane-bound mannosyltransferase
VSGAGPAGTVPGRPYRGRVFTPWGNVVVIVLAAVLAAITLQEVRQKQRRGEPAWDSGRKLRLAAVVVVVVIQVRALL